VVELIYDLIDMQFLFGKCLKPVTIQYLHPGRSERKSTTENVRNTKRARWKCHTAKTSEKNIPAVPVSGPSFARRASGARPRKLWVSAPSQPPPSTAAAAAVPAEEGKGQAAAHPFLVHRVNGGC